MNSPQETERQFAALELRIVKNLKTPGGMVYWVIGLNLGADSGLRGGVDPGLGGQRRPLRRFPDETFLMRGTRHVEGLLTKIANAVFHATGKRIRELPITPEKLI